MRSRVLRLLFAGYLAVVAFGVFGPNPGDELEKAANQVRRAEREVRAVAPGRSSDTTAAGPRPPEEWVFGDLSAEDVGNIAMFLPFGLLLPLAWPRWRWFTVPAGVALSGFIELVQLIFLSWRSPSLGDVGWNSLGTAIGFGLWLAGSWWWRRKRGRPEATAGASRYEPAGARR